MRQYADSTKANYYGVWKQFNKFFIKLDCKPKEWEECLTLYVAYLVDQTIKSSTIKSYISVIKVVLRDVNIKLQEDQILLALLTRACRLHNDTISAHLLIRKGLVKLIVDAISFVFQGMQPYLCCMYRALILVTYYGLFRIGEVMQSVHVIRAQDVHVGSNKDKMLFVLHTSKTHNKGVKPQMVKITSLKHSNYEPSNLDKYCPFTAMKNYIQIWKKFVQDEQLFIFQDRSPVRMTHMRNILHKTILYNKLDASRYSSQGLWAGRACDLLDLGISVETIKKLGRWKSTAVYTYLCN